MQNTNYLSNPVNWWLFDGKYHQKSQEKCDSKLQANHGA